MKTWAWMVMTEPSIFPVSTEPSRLVGPFAGLRKARKWARKYLRSWPFGECRIIPADAKITQGDKEIEPEEPDKVLIRAPWSEAR